MRILLSGLSGTGSTTAAKRIAADLQLEYIYGGQMFRDLAREKGITLEELAESLEDNEDEECQIDERLVEAAKRDDVLVEGRTIGWIFPRGIPAIRIWLTCDLQERLRRVQSREHHARSAENLLRREASDNRRYFALYDIQPDDFSPFDLVVDTTHLSVEDVVDRIEEFVREGMRESMVNSVRVEGSHSPV